MAWTFWVKDATKWALTSSSHLLGPSGIILFTPPNKTKQNKMLPWVTDWIWVRNWDCLLDHGLWAVAEVPGGAWKEGWLDSTCLLSSHPHPAVVCWFRNLIWADETQAPLFLSYAYSTSGCWFIYRLGLGKVMALWYPSVLCRFLMDHKFALAETSLWVSFNYTEFK